MDLHDLIINFVYSSQPVAVFYRRCMANSEKLITKPNSNNLE